MSTNPKKQEVTCHLDQVEFWTATQIGVIRQLQNIKIGRVDSYGAAKDNGWSLHIEGACGEAAVAKTLNVFYNGNIGNLTACDVNNRLKNVEVRTRSKNWHDLILHPKDPDLSPFILVVGKAPNFTLKGWILAKDGKQKEYWKDPSGGRPAFFVPQSSLQPMSTFPSYAPETETL